MSRCRRSRFWTGKGGELVEGLAHGYGTDADARYVASRHIVALTEHPVDRAAECWDGLLTLLRDGDNHQRAIAAKYLDLRTGLVKPKARAAKA